MIMFNKPHFTGNETQYIKNAVLNTKISGDGMYTKLCHEFFEKSYYFKKCLLTTSCTDAIEMAAILADVKQGDEIIAPSYTFVSTINPFILRGASIRFVDSRADQPNIDEDEIEKNITPNTKAIVVVHYAGVACNMGKIKLIAEKYNLIIIEDAAQAIDSYYLNEPLGGIGHLGAFSFHETKNIISGEGGLITINDEKYIERAEIIREKGTNRSKFFRGEIDKYSWVDIGSSFLPSDIIAAFLFAQIENLKDIQTKRISIWNKYYEGLKQLPSLYNIKMPFIPPYATNNAHMFYMVCNSLVERQALIAYCKTAGVHLVFHYQSLHSSTYFKGKYSGEELLNADRFSDCLVRLPLYYDLNEGDQDQVINTIIGFYNQYK